MEIVKVKNRFGRIVDVPLWKAEKMIQRKEAEMIIITEKNENQEVSVPKKRGRPPKQLSN